MEGGVKQNIPLDSAIDVKSSDMLVPVTQPKFLHNRQRFQGHVLPTSLRYEHDGYACGWDVWNFDVIEHEYFPYESNNVEGPYHISTDVSIVRYKNNSNPSYVLLFRKHISDEMKIDIARVWFNVVSRLKSVVNGDSPFVTKDGAVTTIVGNYDGRDYRITINSISGEQTITDGWDLNTVVLSNGTTDITITDLTRGVNFKIDEFMFPGDIYLKSNLTMPFASFVSYTKQEDAPQHNVYTWRLNGDSQVDTTVETTDIVQPDEEGSGTRDYLFTVSDDIMLYDTDTSQLIHRLVLQRDYISTVDGSFVMRTINKDVVIPDKSITSRSRMDFVYYDTYKGNINIEFLHTVFYTAIRNMIVDKQDEALEIGDKKTTWKNNPYNTEDEPFRYWYNHEYLTFMEKFNSTINALKFARTVATAGANASFNDSLMNADESEYDVASMVNMTSYWEAKLDDKLLYFNKNSATPNTRFISGYLPIWFGISVKANIDNEGRERQQDLPLITNKFAGYDNSALTSSAGKNWTSGEKLFFDHNGYFCVLGECANYASISLRLVDTKKKEEWTPDDEFQIWSGEATIYKPRVHIFEHDKCVYIAEYNKDKKAYEPVKLSDPDYAKSYSVTVEEAGGQAADIDIYAVGVDDDMSRGRGKDHWCRYAWFDDTSSKDITGTYVKPSRYTYPGFYRILDDKNDLRVPRFPSYYYENTTGGDESETTNGGVKARAQSPSYAKLYFYPDLVVERANCAEVKDYPSFTDTAYTCPIDIAIANYERGMGYISSEEYNERVKDFKVWWQEIIADHGTIRQTTEELLPIQYNLAAWAKEKTYMGAVCHKQTVHIVGTKFNGIVSDLPDISEFVESLITVGDDGRKGFSKQATYIQWYDVENGERKSRIKPGSFTTGVSGGTSNNNLGKGIEFRIAKEEGFFRVDRKNNLNNYLLADDVLYETDYRKTSQMPAVRVHEPGSETQYRNIPATEAYAGRKYYQNIVDKHIQEMHYRGVYAICVKGKYRFKASLNDYIYPSGDYVRDENGEYIKYTDNNGVERDIPNSPAYSVVFDRAQETDTKGIYIDRNLTETSAKDIGRGDGNRWEHQFVTLYDFSKYAAIRKSPEYETYFKEREEMYGEYGTHSLFHLPHAEIENDSNAALNDDEKLLSRDKDYLLNAYLTVPITTDMRNKFPLFYHKIDSSLDNAADYRLRTRFFIPGHIWLGIDLYDPAIEGYDESVGYNIDALDTGAGLSGYMLTENSDFPREYNITIGISGKVWQYYKVDPWTVPMLVADEDENGDPITDEHNNIIYHTENVYNNVNSVWDIRNGLHPIYELVKALRRSISFEMGSLNITVMPNGFIDISSYQTIVLVMKRNGITYKFQLKYTYDSINGKAPTIDTITEFMTLVSSPTIVDGDYRINLSDVSGRTSFRPIFDTSNDGKNITTDNIMEILAKSNDILYNEEVQLAACLNDAVIDTDYEVYSYENGTAHIYKKSDLEDAWISKSNALLTVENGDTYPIEVFDTFARILVQYNKRQRFNAVIYGPYKHKGINIVSLDDEWFITRLDSDKYGIHKYLKADIASEDGIFTTTKVQSNMRYVYTDVTDPDVLDHTVLEINPNDENQVLKQDSEFTNDIEKFWWIDQMHIFKLGKDKFILEEITEELDDWGANKHNTLAEYNRFTYLTGDVMQYGVTNVYSASANQAKAYFYTVTEFKEHMTITFYDVLNNMDSFEIKAVTTKHSIGERLISEVKTSDGAARLNTYSDISTSMVARGAKLSTTVIDDTILFGIHYDNNFNQWTLVISISSRALASPYVVQGYGFVSLKGVLTGGQIPSDFFSTGNLSGFNGIVRPLTFIDDSGIFKSRETTGDEIARGIPGSYVVGNESQQWYLTNELRGIVSHVIAYDNKATGNKWVWKPEVLDIRNNYSARYDSPSFYTRSISDYIPFAKGIASVFPISTSNSTIKKITKVLSKIASVLGAEIYGIYPKVNTAGYLQQAIGQYAYVHYNSTNNYVENKDEKELDNPYTKDELTFNNMTVSQKATIKNAWGFFIGLLGQFSISACDMAIKSLKANAHQNQTDTGIKGEKYTDSFLKNLDAMASTEMTVQSATPTLNSKVVGSMTLDMFYSTSEQQKIYAGPGFVNHNFVAQCIAQSVTSKHFELNQIGFLLILKSATMFQIEKTIFVEETIITFTQYYADAFSNQTIAIPFGGATNVVSNIAALAMMIANKAAKIALAVTKFVQKYVPDFIDSIGANRMQVNVLARQSSHTYDIEGKHRYGSRSECFMYPCAVDYKYTVPGEYVEATRVNNKWSIDIDQWSDSIGKTKLLSGNSINIQNVTEQVKTAITRDWEGDIPFYSISCKGKDYELNLPENMAYVIGTEAFLPKQAFKNQNISESEPVFATPVIQDYVIDDDWGLFMTATAGEIAWVSCKDTKIIDGAPTNIFINNDFCGIASAYAALQIRDTVDRRFVRPYAVTPNAIAINQTGYNCCYDRKVYHAFDGYGYRLASWIGSTGMGKERQILQYSFIANDRFKRSNKLPPNQFMGNFKSAPEVNIRGDHNDKIYSAISIPGEVDSLIAGTEGEDKDVVRYAIPVFTEHVNTLPAAVKTNAAYTLAIVDGITSLCTDLRNVQFAYKSPRSVDFNIGGELYRYTSEYISSIEEKDGVIVVNNLVPVLGLSFLGATPYEAYFYSQATRQYYVYRGGTKLDVADMIERFRNVTDGKYDFVNQEVVMPCLATFNRLDKHVHDDDSELDNIIVPVLKRQDFAYEVSPPIDTIFNDESWFKTLSMPSGIVYQGPNRCIINRYVISDYMYKSLKENAGNWKKVSREDYHPVRQYSAHYETVDEQIGPFVNVNGWTHNPFLLVTSPLGVSEDIDCMFEWELTFAWTVEMDKIYSHDNYICVNVSAETMTPGGKVVCRPTHIFLTKELFTRTGNYGYYSFRFQSKNGAGNRERLHVWSDGYIAISGIQCEYKPVTERRTEVLTQQIDVHNYKEF